MKPIATGLDILQGDISIGYLLPTLHKIKGTLTSMLSEDLTYCTLLVQVLLEGLNKRYVI